MPELEWKTCCQAGTVKMPDKNKLCADTLKAQDQVQPEIIFQLPNTHDVDCRKAAFLLVGVGHLWQLPPRFNSKRIETFRGHAVMISAPNNATKHTHTWLDEPQRHWQATCKVIQLGYQLNSVGISVFQRLDRRVAWQIA